MLPFANDSNKQLTRDLSAQSNGESSIFMLPIDKVRIIRDNFEEIYLEMVHLASKRFKYHQLWIAYRLNKLIQDMEQLTMSTVAGSSAIEEVDLDNKSLDSEILDDTFQTQIKGLPKGVHTQGKDYYRQMSTGKPNSLALEKANLIDLETPGIRDMESEMSTGLSRMPSLFLEKVKQRQTQFEQIFDHSLGNLSSNVLFLEEQGQRVQ